MAKAARDDRWWLAAFDRLPVDGPCDPRFCTSPLRKVRGMMGCQEAVGWSPSPALRESDVGGADVRAAQRVGGADVRAAQRAGVRAPLGQRPAGASPIRRRAAACFPPLA